MVVLVVVCACAVACDGVTPTTPNTGTPAASVPPTRTVPPTPTTLTLGETITSAVSADDPHCDTADPTVEELDAPCKTFQFTAPRTGTVVAHLTWPSPNIFLELLTPLYGTCCTSPLSLTFGVRAGVTYSVSVGFHGIAGSAQVGSAPFELATSLTP